MLARGIVGSSRHGTSARSKTASWRQPKSNRNSSSCSRKARPSSVASSAAGSALTSVVANSSRRRGSSRTVRLSAHRPRDGLHRAGVEPLQRLVRLGRFVWLDHLVVEVAEGAARQQDEVDVPVDPPLVAHLVGQLVELGDELGIAEARVVGGLQRHVGGDDRRLPLLLPRLADRRHLGGELVVVVDQPALDLGVVGYRVEGDVEEVVDLLRGHHDRAVVLRLGLGEPLREGVHDEVEGQRCHRSRRVHLVERPEPLDLARPREHDLIARRRHSDPPT